MSKNGKKIRFLRGEKLLLVAILVALVSIPIVNVYSKTKVSETNIDLETVKNNIERQESINEALDMKISELASLDKIQEVAKEIGLSYNNDNIKVVNAR